MIDSENIKTLARNRLMVFIIAIIYEESKILPQRRAEIYKLAVDVLLERLDHQRVEHRFTKNQKEFILKKLAFQFHKQHIREMKETEILKEIGKYSSRIGLKEDQIKLFLDEIWQRSYLLRQMSGIIYYYLHFAFQEYYTALELMLQKDVIGTIIGYIADPSGGRSPFFFMLGFVKMQDH